MSIFDVAGSIAGGFVDGVKSAFGFQHVTPHKASSAASDSSTSVSKKHPTTFDRTPTTSDTRPNTALPTGDTTTPPPGNEDYRDPSSVWNDLPTGDTNTPPPEHGSTTPDPSATGSGATDQASTPNAAARRYSVRVFDSTAQTGDGRAGYVGNQDSLASSGAQDARAAAANAQRGLQYYDSTFGRNGIDNAGSGVDIVLNDHSRNQQGQEIFHGNGGYYTTRDATGNLTEAVRWGDGTRYNHARGGAVEQYSMLYADDLTIHELTHGIIKRETGSIGGTADEAGSVNEGLADVMAASATRDWRMGEGMYSDASDYKYMRNIANPDDPQAVHQLWTSMQQYNDARSSNKVEEHYASGIVSNAAYRIQSRLGGESGWKAVEQVFYHTIQDHRLGTLSFADTAAGLRASASSIFGAQSNEAQVVDEELRRAGL